VVSADGDEPQAAEKLAILAETTDGFRIAEEDLRRRGPGEFIGTRQHGLPPLAIGDFTSDIALLLEARRDAFALVAEDPHLRRKANHTLKAAIAERFGSLLELATVG